MRIPGIPFGKVDIGITKRDREIVRSVHRPLFTPDRPFLQQKIRHKMFIHDEWMSDRRQNFVLEGERMRFDVFTRGVFHFWTRDDDFLPITLPTRDGTGYRIRGELVHVTPNEIERLDKLKQNGIQFCRIKIYVLDLYRGTYQFENLDFSNNILDGRFPSYSEHPLAGVKNYISVERVFLHQAWMYVAKDFWWKTIHKRPECFNPVPRFKPSHERRFLSEYYEYQNPPR